MMASLADAQQNKNRLTYEEGLHIQRLSVLYMKPSSFFIGGGRVSVRNICMAGVKERWMSWLRGAAGTGRAAEACSRIRMGEAAPREKDAIHTTNRSIDHGTACDTEKGAERAGPAAADPVDVE